MVETEDTYLMWLDCRAYGQEEEALKDLFLKKAKLCVEIGSKFSLGGEGFICMNIACPRKILMEGSKRPLHKEKSQPKRSLGWPDFWVLAMRDDDFPCHLVQGKNIIS